MPLSACARSDSIAMRRPRPYPVCRRRSCVVIASKSIERPAGIPSRIATSAWPCDSPAVRKRSISASFYPKTRAAFLHRRRDHRPMEAAMQLVGARFVLRHGIEHGERRAIDLATAARVILTIGTAGGASEQTRWSVRCDWLHRLHHRSIAPLVDFGIVGETLRFEAWRCTEIWQGSPGVARAARERADRFFRSNALTPPLDAHAAVYSAQTGAVVLPDSGTGYRSPVDRSREAVSLDACGISV